MSADRAVAVGEYGHSKVRCDGHTDGRRCYQEALGGFRRGVADARRVAAEAGWAVRVRVQYAPNGSDLRDYCPDHRARISVAVEQNPGHCLDCYGGEGVCAQCPAAKDATS